ncbi:DedA family protein [Amnimonas aquatica]|uniref:DedA family protein n=1 Tax=Amnimonas aquatica TaxID=2094561 RepID=A0A2P6ARH4_9GAMM|nr:DedA family protein [Amnimonas aquatica]PQA36933.1 DedA family protein [Amnimonas aquatica]
MELIDFILHVDVHLQQFAAANGALIYGLLFLIVFVETGVVVMPFLPGDSLLFAAGALAATGVMDPWVLFFLLWFAAVLGDNCNYWIGRTLGQRIYASNSRWIRREYIDKTQVFFEHHGGKAIVIARFMPIFRTFTPFVAGVGRMPYRRFFVIDVFGGLVWVGSFIWLGYGFGNLPVVKDNFMVVVFTIIGLSVLPGIIAFVRVKLAARAARRNA